MISNCMDEIDLRKLDKDEIDKLTEMIAEEKKRELIKEGEQEMKEREEED